MKPRETKLRLVGPPNHTDRDPEPVGLDGAVGLAAAADEAELVARALRNDSAAFELLMRRNNQRMYRVIRSLLKDPAEAEDVMQQAYLQAFVHLSQFDGSARWSTWVCRIGVNAALARLRQRGQFVSIDSMNEDGTSRDLKAATHDPERTAASRELGLVVEEAIEGLPEAYRAVLVMREVEGMSTTETAEILGVDQDVVKTRLHRARTALRNAVEDRVGEQLKTAYVFGNERCDRLVAEILRRLQGT